MVAAPHQTKDKQRFWGSLVWICLWAGLLVGCGANAAPLPTAVALAPMVGPVVIQSVVVLQNEASPTTVQVVVKGSLPDNCSSLVEGQPTFNGQTIALSLTFLRPSDRLCASVAVPFERALSLNMEGQADGRYTIQLNTVSQSFDWARTPSRGTALINGRVWHDLCSAGGGEGCVPIENGLFLANGILENGEPGIEGVLMNLGQGHCPAKGFASQHTNSLGTYSFDALPAGDYCVSADLLDPINSFLLPGSWTYPGLNIGSANVTLDVGENKLNVDFGWDFELYPEPTPLVITCQDSAFFLEDITIPDDTPVAAGQPFTKTWRLQNSGTCTWNKAYAIIFADGERMDAPQILPLTQDVPPQASLDVSIPMVAPLDKGTYRSEWLFTNGLTHQNFGLGGPDGAGFWVQIVVEESATATPTPPPTATESPTESPTVSSSATPTAVPTTVPSTPIIVTATAVASPEATATPSTGSIGGLIWDDVCQVSAGDGVFSAGCVPISGGGYKANGLLDSDETGIQGVEVSLFTGACPGNGRLPTKQQSDENGLFLFENLLAGPYCLTVAPLSPANAPILQTGLWTWPESGQNSLTIELPPGEKRTDVNFGWDYQ